MSASAAKTRTEETQVDRIDLELSLLVPSLEDALDALAGALRQIEHELSRPDATGEELEYLIDGVIASLQNDEIGGPWQIEIGKKRRAWVEESVRRIVTSSKADKEKETNC